MTLHTFILILHVLGAGIVFAVTFFAVALTIKSTWSMQTLDRLRFVGKFGMWSSAWQLVTGLILSIQHWDELHASKLFWTKMIIYVVEGTFASMLVERKLRTANDQRAPKGINTIMLTHMVLILAIVALGVMIMEQ